MTGKLIIFSAPSGSGKTTLVRHLMAQDYNLHFSVSATSRQIRINETNGKDYLFLSVADFKKRIEDNEFLEWEEVYPNRFYGTLKSEVDKMLKTGNHVIFDVDVKGGINIKTYYGAQALSIFVRPPSIEALEKRLRKRNTDDEADIAKRIAKAKYELDFEKYFDAVIINENIQQARNDAEQLVRQFLHSGK